MSHVERVAATVDEHIEPPTEEIDVTTRTTTDKGRKLLLLNAPLYATCSNLVAFCRVCVIIDTNLRQNEGCNVLAMLSV